MAAPEEPDSGGPPLAEEEVPEASALVKWTSLLIVLAYLAGTGIAALVAWSRGPDTGEGEAWAITFGLGTVGLGLALLHLIGRRSIGGFGIFRPLIGADRRFSTSLTQLGLWTLAIASGFASLLGRVMFDGAQLDAVLPPTIWDQYLVLLGGPFAAAVLAKGIVTYKLQSGTLQKTEPTSTSATQVFTGDDGSANLVDAQYLIFNMIALSYFIIRLIATGILPEIPPTLLALTGSTAALFVAYKAAQKNAPTITSVTPSSAKPGDFVTVFGTNFDPADPSDQGRRITVALTGVPETIYSNYTTDTLVRFKVPAAAAIGDQEIRVTSTAGVETEPHELEVLPKT